MGVFRQDFLADFFWTLKCDTEENVEDCDKEAGEEADEYHTEPKKKEFGVQKFLKVISPEDQTEICVHFNNIHPFQQSDVADIFIGIIFEEFWNGWS